MVDLLFGCLVGWLVGRLVAWLVVSVGWLGFFCLVGLVCFGLFGWLVWLVGLLVCSLVDLFIGCSVGRSFDRLFNHSLAVAKCMCSPPALVWLVGLFGWLVGLFGWLVGLFGWLV